MSTNENKDGTMKPGSYSYGLTVSWFVNYVNELVGNALLVSSQSQRYRLA